MSSLRSDDIGFSEEDTAELLATVEESVDQLTALVDNLLDSSRLAAGVVRPELKRVYLEEVVQRALLSISRGTTGFGSQGLDRIKVDVGDAVAMADAGLLERVLANLIDNALRYAPQSIVRVNAGRVGDRMLINVVDEGPGVPRGAEDQMFEAFQRLGDRHNKYGVGPWPFGGQGVRRGDGRDHLGHRHPRWRPDGHRRPGGAAGGTAVNKVKVLVIDDEPQILRALRINLSVRGYEVITAATGAAALKAAAEQRPDVIVLDLGLPDMSGIEVLDGLARLVERTRHRAVGAHRFHGEGRGAGRRRRRLRDQAVRDGRVPGPAARGGAPWLRRPRRPTSPWSKPIRSQSIWRPRR